MNSTKTTLYILLSFLICIVLTCIANFILQIIFIFLVELKRLNESDAYIVVLWIVTGVFCTVFTVGMADTFLGEKKENFKKVGIVLSIIAALGIILSSFLIYRNGIRDPQEFSLILSNHLVQLSYFIGIGGMAFIFTR